MKLSYSMCKVGTYKLFENMLECNIICNCTDKHANNLSVGRYVNFLMGHAISSKKLYCYT